MEIMLFFIFRAELNNEDLYNSLKTKIGMRF